MKTALKANTEAAYGTYLDACAPNYCGHQTEARQHLNDLVAKREAQERAERDRLAQEAEQREAAAQREARERDEQKQLAQAATKRQDADDRAMKTARGAATESAYRAYLDACAPNGCGHQAEARKRLKALAAERAADQKKLDLQLAKVKGLLDKSNILAARRALDEAKAWDRQGAVAALRQEHSAKLQAAARAFLEQRRPSLARRVLEDLERWDPRAPELAALRKRLSGRY